MRWLAIGEHEVPEDDEWLTERERAWLARMRFPKRRLEYRLARWGAKVSIANAVAPHARIGAIEIGYLPEGAPTGYVDGVELDLRISMTDRAGWAVCAVAPPGVEVGVDLELVEPRTRNFVNDYFTPAEQALAARRGEVDPVMANLIWSAKESALKVLRTGLRRDTRSVEIAGDAVRDGAWSAFQAEVDGGSRSFDGWWRRSGHFLLTVAGDAATDVPVALTPDPLAAAEPVHSWQGQAPRR